MTEQQKIVNCAITQLIITLTYFQRHKLFNDLVPSTLRHIIWHSEQSLLTLQTTFVDNPAGFTEPNQNSLHDVIAQLIVTIHQLQYIYCSIDANLTFIVDAKHFRSESCHQLQNKLYDFLMAWPTLELPMNNSIPQQIENIAALIEFLACPVYESHHQQHHYQKNAHQLFNQLQKIEFQISENVSTRTVRSRSIFKPHTQPITIDIIQQIYERLSKHLGKSRYIQLKHYQFLINTFFITETPSQDQLEEKTKNDYLWDKTLREQTGAEDYYFNHQKIDPAALQQMAICSRHTDYYRHGISIFKQQLAHVGIVNPIVQDFLSQQFHQDGIIKIADPLISSYAIQQIEHPTTAQMTLLAEGDKVSYITYDPESQITHVKIISFLYLHQANNAIHLDSYNRKQQCTQFIIDYDLIIVQESMQCINFEYTIMGTNSHLLQPIFNAFVENNALHSGQTRSAPATPETPRKQGSNHRLSLPTNAASAPNSPFKSITSAQ